MNCISAVRLISSISRSRRLSIAIRNLEEDIGGALFVRNQRSVQLTELGRILLRHAVSILERVETCEQELRAVVAGAAGQLRISFTAASSLLSPFPALIHAFRQRYAWRNALRTGRRLALRHRALGSEIRPRMVRLSPGRPHVSTFQHGGNDHRRRSRRPVAAGSGYGTRRRSPTSSSCRWSTRQRVSWKSVWHSAHRYRSRQDPRRRLPVLARRADMRKRAVFPRSSPSSPFCRRMDWPNRHAKTCAKQLKPQIFQYLPVNN